MSDNIRIVDVSESLTTSEISNLAAHRRRGTRKTVINETGHQIAGVNAAMAVPSTAAWIGTMAGRGIRAGEETTIGRAGPHPHVETMPMDAAVAVATTVALTTVTLALDPGLGHLGLEGTGRTPTAVGVPVQADTVRPNLSLISRNGLEPRSRMSS